ncbi:hypothetical protein MARCHEWKA_03130 [Brevundimonas phage vB_BpoS-Marchewka]|uniref:Uncharacterized protein n=1 Tax=Brevundimonas phage vB_BpoS-Marchewka TaxID=2948604 RepID=A0A9E7N4L9_9CAUD|nr:hypothetical protein MARCHEWKA_03130 [Brevundimonas phage vB_BpoS-Marchewka]UTC29272.1 hypothetical protein BAMBUS_01900 [Brevundimonas phage vB_BpoS-Bambus]
MIRQASSRTAFPTETRKVPGTDDYKSHILAFCRNCDAEGAILIPNNAGSVPPEAGSKMFRRRLGWKMGAHRNKDVCPSCAARSKIACVPQDKRQATLADLSEKLKSRVALDPEYTRQKEYDVLYQDFPLLAILMASVEIEHAEQGRALPSNLQTRAEVLLQAALKRARRDHLLDDAMLSEIDDRIEQIHTLMAELDEQAVTLIPLMEQVNATDMPQPRPAKEAEPMHSRPVRPDTALGAAFVKAQTDKIKQAGAQRPPRTPEDQATLDRLISDQARDDRRGVRLVGKARKAPLPPAKPEPAAARPVLSTVPSEPAPARKAPNRVKRTGGWDSMTPEEHADRVARMTIKRNLKFAAKAGLSLEDWTERNEARKAETEARRLEKASKKAAKPVLRLVESSSPQTPKPEKPMNARPAPMPIHDNTVTPTAPGVLDRLKISEALNEHYVRATSNGEGGYYIGDFSDAGLAALLGVPAEWVAERREAMLYGPDVNEATSQDALEIEALKDEVKVLKTLQEKLFDDGAHEVEQIEARQSALMAQIKDDTKAMLDAASEKVASQAAVIEDRVVDLEQRLHALAERR